MVWIPPTLHMQDLSIENTALGCLDTEGCLSDRRPPRSQCVFLGEPKRAPPRYPKVTPHTHEFPMSCCSPFQAPSLAHGSCCSKARSTAMKGKGGPKTRSAREGIHESTQSLTCSMDHSLVDAAVLQAWWTSVCGMSDMLDVRCLPRAEESETGMYDGSYD